MRGRRTRATVSLGSGDRARRRPAGQPIEERAPSRRMRPRLERNRPMTTTTCCRRSPAAVGDDDPVRPGPWSMSTCWPMPSPDPRGASRRSGLSDTMIPAAQLVAMVAGGANGEPGWALSVCRGAALRPPLPHRLGHGGPHGAQESSPGASAGPPPHSADGPRCLADHEQRKLHGQYVVARQLDRSGGANAKDTVTRFEQGRRRSSRRTSARRGHEERASSRTRSAGV